jgi:heme/copper-type cytochrome/quinol oxidase subunit 2
MAENLILLVAIASVVGVFFLVLFSVLARRERRDLRKVKGANPSTRGVGAFQISWRVAYAVLVLVAILAVISFLPWRSRR